MRKETGSSIDNALEVPFSATPGEELEIEMALVLGVCS
jgi:hypothetical protein